MVRFAAVFEASLHGAVCGSELQRVASWCVVLQRVALFYTVPPHWKHLQVLQSVAAFCSVLQCVAV